MSENGPERGRRPGEVALDADPARMEADAHLVFLGRVHSPWRHREECPKNMAQARERSVGAQIELLPAYRPGLRGLSGFSHVVVLTWFDRSARDLILQVPRHAPEPRGTFALRSPARPNPIGLHVARLLAVDEVKGLVSLDAIDVIDGTPVIDIKPYFASIDAFPDAVRAG